MSQANTTTQQELQAEVTRLNEELKMRDQLVQQLSQELFRLVKGNSAVTAQQEIETSERHQTQVKALREQLQEVEQQVKFYQEQIAERDIEVYQLNQSVDELTERSRMLEQVVQELPGVYRQKFSERLNEVMAKVDQLQQENRQLHAELQSVSYRLAQKSRRPNTLDLPSFQSNGSVEFPALKNA
ncbi:MAG: Npun_F5560 family protein [Microcoleaceae cyanobacterium]